LDDLDVVVVSARLIQRENDARYYDVVVECTKLSESAISIEMEISFEMDLRD